MTSGATSIHPLIDEVLATFFALRAAGQALGLVSESGGGNWGLLRQLRDQGPLTIADIARERGVSRQYIQKLANELIKTGWVTRVENPAHQRSFLLALTPAGSRQLASMDSKLDQLAATLAPAFNSHDIATTRSTLAALRAALDRPVTL